MYAYSKYTELMFYCQCILTLARSVISWILIDAKLFSWKSSIAGLLSRSDLAPTLHAVVLEYQDHGKYKSDDQQAGE